MSKKNEDNILHFPTDRVREPDSKIDLYDSLSSLIKGSTVIKNKTQVWLFMSWFMNEVLGSRSFYVNSKKLAEIFLIFYEDNDSFHNNEMALFRERDEEFYRKSMTKASVSIDTDEDYGNALGLASFILYVYKNNL